MNPRRAGGARRVRPAAVALSLLVLVATAGAHASSPADVGVPASDRARLHASSARIHQLMAGERFRAAIPLAERQLAERRRLLQGDHLLVAHALDTLGRLEYTQGAYETAYEHHAQALAIREARLGARDLEVASSLDQMGLVLKGLNSREDPMPYYQRALDIRRAARGAEHPDVATSWMLIGNLQRMRREYDTAIGYFERAIAIRRRTLGPNHADLGASLADMALTLTAMGAWERAEPYAREALAIQRALPIRREQDYPMCLDITARLLARRGQYAAAESLLTESAELREAQRKRAAPGEGRSRMFPLLMYLDLANVQLAQGKGEAAWTSLEKSLARGLCEAVAHDGPRHGKKKGNGVKPLPLADVQRALAPDVALIGWFETRRGGGAVVSNRWGYVIRDHGPIHWQRVESHPDSDSVTPMISARYLQDLRAAGSWPLRVTDLTAVREQARAHYERNLAPLAEHLAGVRSLIVISPDVLYGVPIESWADDADRFVADRYVVSYAPSAAWFVRLHRDERPSAPDQWQALLIGDPEVNGAPTPSSQTFVTATAATHTAPAWLATQRPLPRARDEVSQVAALMHHADVLVGEQASEAEIHRLVGSPGTELEFAL